MRLFVIICRALAIAHQRGVVHRDLKPSNIRVDQTGKPYILDFGLAKLSRPGTAEDTAQHSMTQTGQLLGSLPWTSPEQLAGAAAVDARIDVYSLGVMLFQALAGGLPRQAKRAELKWPE